MLAPAARRGYETPDLSDNEMAKLHVRHMVGGRTPHVARERLCRFEFPERPGALLQFLDALGGRWNISLFHYRNHGADFGRVLAAFEVPDHELGGIPGISRRPRLSVSARGRQPCVPPLSRLTPVMQAFDTSVIVRTRRKLSRCPELSVTSGRYWLRVDPRPTAVFPSTCGCTPAVFSVRLGGWTRRFDRDDDAIDCVEFGLSSACRLLVEYRGIGRSRLDRRGEGIRHLAAASPKHRAPADSVLVAQAALRIAESHHADSRANEAQEFGRREPPTGESFGIGL